MKKFVSILLCVIFAFAMLIPAYAETDNKLRFNEDGNFRIMQISDVQDGTLLTPAAKKFIKEVVIEAKPDLVVLTGDNISAGSATIGIEAIDLQLVKYGISHYMSVFEEIGVPVAVVFGNHDAEEIVSKEDHMAFYTEYDCCVAIDEGDALYGCGTYNLPIYSSKDDSKVAYNLFMIDSNMYDDVNGGYDYVHEDQIKWYVDTAKALKEQNGGKTVPSMMFQHIIVKEIYDVIEEISAEEAKTRENVEDNGKYYSFKAENYKVGALNEMPCPPTYNGGQFDAIVNQGDVVAMFFGHDHKNTFEVSYKGVDLINSPTSGFGSYGDEGRGVRIIDINENTTDYETSIITYVDFYADNDSMLAQYDLYANESSVGEVIVAFFKTIFFAIANIF